MNGVLLRDEMTKFLVNIFSTARKSLDYTIIGRFISPGDSEGAYLMLLLVMYGYCYYEIM